MNAENGRVSRSDPPRWKPALGIVLVSASLLFWKWFVSDAIRQERIVFTAGVLALGSLLLLLWLLIVSRLRWRIRLIGLATFCLLILLAFLSLRVRGVTGDVVPILEWRWSANTATELETMVSEAGADGRSVFADLGPAGQLAMRGYPQFLGPDRNGVVQGVALETDWEVHPPQLVWRRPIGAGWSGFALTDGFAVTQEQDGENETVVAYEALTGKEVWRYSYAARYESGLAGLGPRATPTLDSGRVYANGATGILNCIDLKSGTLIWSRDLIREHDSTNPNWGNSCSPLIHGDHVILSVGGTDGQSLVAYHKENGSFVWAGGSDAMGYSSPQVRVIAGAEQIIAFNHASVAGHDPTDGRILWILPWSKAQPNVSQPLVLPGDRILVSSGYGIGSKLFRIRKSSQTEFEVEKIWETPRLKAKFTDLVFHDGFVYGLDDGILMCLDPNDGSAKWKRGRYGHGQVILVEDLLLLQTEHGEIVLIDPNPDQLSELTRLEVFQHKSWNPPALAGNYLLVRTDLEAACYRLSIASSRNQ